MQHVKEEANGIVSTLHCLQSLWSMQFLVIQHINELGLGEVNVKVKDIQIDASLNRLYDRLYELHNDGDELVLEVVEI